MRDSKSATIQKELRPWLEGRTIVGVTYNSGNVLALELDDGNFMICYTETIAKAVGGEK